MAIRAAEKNIVSMYLVKVIINRKIIFIEIDQNKNYTLIHEKYFN